MKNKNTNLELSNNYLERGLYFMSKNKFSEAIENFTEAIDNNPNNEIAFYQRGLISYIYFRDYEEAINDLDEAIFINKEYYYAYLTKGQILVELGLFQEAIKNYNQVITYKSDCALAYFLRGNAFEKLECHTESIENYENAIKLEPQKADFYYAKGWAYTNLKQYQNAIFCYDKAINLGLKDYNVFYEKSLALYLLNDNQQALELIDKAIVINQNGYEAYNLRGNIKLNLLLDINDIIKDYTQAIQLNSFYSPAYFSRGTAYILLCDYKAALQDINYSELLDSELTKSACFNRGRIYRELGDFDSAITEFSKSIRIEENSLHYYNRALCYFDINNYEKAIQDYSFTIQFLPKSTNFLIPTNHIYFQRGLAYENLNNIDNAISDYHQAIILDSNCTEARCCLEKINSYYISTKDFINEILGIYKQKIKIDKDNRENRITLIKDICTKREINYLFHFTHKSNFTSILNKGLLPRETLDTYKYNYKFNDHKRSDNCRNAICLSVGFPQYRMLFTLTGRKNQSDWIILLLNPSILWMFDCAFCYDNAASSSVTSIPIEKRKEADQLNKIDLLGNKRETESLHSKDFIISYQLSSIQIEVP